MLKTVVPERHRKRFKTSYSKEGAKLGKCLICDERVRNNHKYLTTSEGYAHKKCLRDWKSGGRDD